MKPEAGHEPAVRLGRGRILSPESLRVLGKALASKNPAADWAKGRVLAMTLTVSVLVWGIGGVMDLLAADPLPGDGEPYPVMAEIDDRSEGDSKTTGGIRAKERLRNDLFKVTKPKKDIKKKEPKTNPAELLRLLELQGVLGGNCPRAIVFFKQTKKTITVSVGDDLGEFEVREIRDRSVILKWREELFELSL